MGRTNKPGISFYRVDSGHIRNDKIRLLCNEFDSDGYYIWSCILDYGYMKYGYYFDCNDTDSLELFASDYCRKKVSLVNEVIAGCLRRGLFDKAVFELSGILTCEFMQEVYMYGTFDRRKKGSVFTMVKDWILIDLEEYKNEGIKIVPREELDSSQGRKQIFPDNNSQTETKTKTETKTETKTKNSLPAAAPPELKKSSTRKGQKKEKPPEPYWDKLVKIWFDFNKENFGDEPSFTGFDQVVMKRILGRLKKRAEKATVEWTEANAVTRFTNFLKKAYSFTWLKDNFLFGNLEKQFDKIILNQSNGDTNGTAKKDHSHRATITGTATTAGSFQ